LFFILYNSQTITHRYIDRKNQNDNAATNKQRKKQKKDTERKKFNDNKHRSKHFVLSLPLFLNVQKKKKNPENSTTTTDSRKKNKQTNIIV